MTQRSPSSPPFPPGHGQGSVPAGEELTFSFDDAGFANELFGPHNANLELLARTAQLHIATRGAAVSVKGEPGRAALVHNLLMQLYDLLRSGSRLRPHDVAHAYALLERNPEASVKTLFQDVVFAAPTRKNIVAKTASQREYVAALRDSDMTFAVGPAGTGKTYLAVAMALSLLLAKRIRRLILTRPAVEAGERLGFLPGDLAEKVNPYLRPLYDALHDMLDAGKTEEMIETGVIEIAPLAFMRGRTLNDAFIILDEAQNTTPEQMKMFVTRLGFGSRAAITGDITQIDLPAAGGVRHSGLIQALEVLGGVDGIRIVHFGKEDVIRHPLVSRIVSAYDNYEEHSG